MINLCKKTICQKNGYSIGITFTVDTFDLLDNGTIILKSDD